MSKPKLKQHLALGLCQHKFVQVNVELEWMFGQYESERARSFMEQLAFLLTPCLNRYLGMGLSNIAVFLIS